MASETKLKPFYPMVSSVQYIRDHQKSSCICSLLAIALVKIMSQKAMQNTGRCKLPKGRKIGNNCSLPGKQKGAHLYVVWTVREQLSPTEPCPQPGLLGEDELESPCQLARA